eukprot:TRINITY_DN3989_c0_g1_i8.p4 TRINITY_DN3989_c0_g1~~TRINITY_DN3989_c0_g1_i8.p4  ORF type:complete len:137 (+),score=2.88 TRINITY_DN3989_c0_g1_i8:877-1287(+)
MHCKKLNYQLGKYPWVLYLLQRGQLVKQGFQKLLKGGFMLQKNMLYELRRNRLVDQKQSQTCHFGCFKFVNKAVQAVIKVLDKGEQLEQIKRKVVWQGCSKIFEEGGSQNQNIVIHVNSKEISYNERYIFYVNCTK